MNINEHIKWTNTRTYCTDKNMLLTNLTKHWEESHVFNAKYEKFRLARSQSVTYVFRYVLYKKRAILSTTTEELVTPAPPTPTPTRALYAKLQREKLQFLSLLTTILKALIYWKLESFRGLCPCTPPGALRWALGPHPYEARWRERGALRAHTVHYAHGFFRPPFLKILDPPLYTSPLARPSRLPPPPLTRYARYATDALTHFARL